MANAAWVALLPAERHLPVRGFNSVLKPCFNPRGSASLCRRCPDPDIPLFSIKHILQSGIQLLHTPDNASSRDNRDTVSGQISFSWFRGLEKC